MSPGSAAQPPGSGGPPDASGAAAASPNRRALRLALLVVLGVLVFGALASGRAVPPGSATFPPVGTTTGPAGGAAALTKGDVTRALAAQGVPSEDGTGSYRPAEAPAFATAPRILLRAILPADPDRGLILIYEFASPAAALAAAEEQAAYIASGVGRVQFATDAQFIVRVVGSTAAFFSWSPSNSPDPGTASIVAALRTLGIEVPVPN
ncbi:MAG: hypothetical protein HW391_992 [Chloroflexi bacterium]|nr:hypothetical protein [Chloroflexota bacterium]